MILDSLRNNLITPMQILFYQLDSQLLNAFRAGTNWIFIEFLILGASRLSPRLYQLQYRNGERVMLTPMFYCLVDTRELWQIRHIGMLQTAASFTTLDWDCSPLHCHKVMGMVEVLIDLKDSAYLDPSQRSTRCN